MFKIKHTEGKQRLNTLFYAPLSYAAVCTHKVCKIWHKFSYATSPPRQPMRTGISKPPPQYLRVLRSTASAISVFPATILLSLGLLVFPASRGTFSSNLSVLRVCAIPLCERRAQYLMVAGISVCPVKRVDPIINMLHSRRERIYILKVI